MKYGLPYKGSKNKLAERIIDLFPKKENLYDLFCGGGAITHCALLGNKFKKVYMNDINPMCTQLFIDSVQGKYKNETRWISREDFYKLKDTDPYIAFCWSFGNNLRDYLYSQDLEPYKKALHYVIVFGDYSLGKELGFDFSVVDTIQGVQERKLFLQRYLKNNNIGKDSPLKESIKCSAILQSLNNLERLDKLQSLNNLERLETSSKSYKEIEIKPNSIIYCDIPYFKTNSYGKKNVNTFDYECFYDWCKNQKELVFISSYEMPDDFISVADFEHRSVLSATANNKVVEKIFIPKHQIKMFEENKSTLF